jgi:pimeloyl-ACP methyl ester carboxylesterase
MQKIAVMFFRQAGAATLLASALVAQPASAQHNSNDVRASWATLLVPYYAPYALQAAAAYIPVSSFDATLGPGGQPLLNGADIALAVSPYASDPNPEIAKRATKYLQSWQYQFGSDGYMRCFDSTEADCQKAFQHAGWAISGGPTFHVWARTRFPQRAGSSCREVSIAFRGTTPTAADWVSNLEPVTGYVYDDYYSQLRRNIDAIIRKITTLDCYRRARRIPQIVSVGHSLGGGLAQLAALANNPERPRIAKVFAFDPSPVTGAGLVDQRIRFDNATGLEIDRIYQTGEVLQRLRYVQQFPQKSSSCVRTVVFDGLPKANAIALHSIGGMTREMVDLSIQGAMAYRAPDRIPCPSRYRAPATDEDTIETPVPEGAPVASLRSQIVQAAGRRPIMMEVHLRTDSVEFAPPQAAEIFSTPVKLVPASAHAEGAAIHRRHRTDKRRVPGIRLGAAGTASL